MCSSDSIRIAALSSLTGIWAAYVWRISQDVGGMLTVIFVGLTFTITYLGNVGVHGKSWLSLVNRSRTKLPEGGEASSQDLHVAPHAEEVSEQPNLEIEKQQIRDLRKQSRLFRLKHSRLKTDNDKLKTNIATLESQLPVVREQFEAEKAALGTIKEEIDEHKELLLSIGISVQEERQKEESVSESLYRKQEDLETATADNEHQQSKLENLRVELQENEARLAAMQRELERADTEITAKTALLDKLGSQVQDREQLKRILEADSAQLVKQVGLFRRYISALWAEPLNHSSRIESMAGPDMPSDQDNHQGDLNNGVAT